MFDITMIVFYSALNVAVFTGPARTVPGHWRSSTDGLSKKVMRKARPWRLYDLALMLGHDNVKCSQLTEKKESTGMSSEKNGRPGCGSGGCGQGKESGASKWTL
jgi:hypothetical protein